MLLFACYSLYQYFVPNIIRQSQDNIAAPETRQSQDNIVTPEARRVLSFDCSDRSYTVATTGHKTIWSDTHVTLTVMEGQDRVTITGVGQSLFEGRKEPFKLEGEFSQRTRLGSLIKEHTSDVNGWYRVPYIIKYCETHCTKQHICKDLNIYFQLVSKYGICGELYLFE